MALEIYGHEDVIMRLDRTICMYKDIPYFVTVTTGQEMDPTNKNLVKDIKLTPLKGTEKSIFINHTDKEFSYSSLQLGYMLYRDTITEKKMAFFMTRAPRRIQKQGLAIEYTLSEPSKRFPDNRWFSGAAMYDCITGNHPRLSKAIEKIENETHSSCPIHRHLAVGRLDSPSRCKRIGLLYRARLIAYLDTMSDVDDKRFVLFPSHDASFMKKLIDKLIAADGFSVTF